MQEPNQTAFEASDSQPCLWEDSSPAVNWSMDPAKGSLQGPLDLGFFIGQTICLDLSAAQVALEAGEGRLSRLFLEGHHTLPVGTGPDMLYPDHHLIFLDLEHPLRFSWTRSDPVAWGPEARRFLLGECAVTINSPRAFFDTFLAGNNCLDPAFIQRLVEQVVRAALATVLVEILPPAEDLDFSAMQKRLLDLTPPVLDPNLEPFGLVCRALSAYTLSPEVTRRASCRDVPEIAGQ